MPARPARRQPPQHKPNKSEIKKQKRKRDHEDVHKIEEAIAELVSGMKRKQNLILESLSLTMILYRIQNLAS
jgi:hypothetical protein